MSAWYGAGLLDGIELGRRMAEAEMSAAWNALSAGMLAGADPQSPEARESAQRRVQAAVEGGRRDAETHYREFMRRAQAMPQAGLDARDRTGKLICPEPLRAAAEAQGRRVQWAWQQRRAAA